MDNIVNHHSTTHGLSRSREYMAYYAMLNRCYNPECKPFPSYGGRGIIVCDRWRASFLNFFEDMGRRPSPGHSIDRKDNDGPYSKDNCWWSERLHQCNNKRNNRLLTVGGITDTIAGWGRRTGINRLTIQQRIVKFGWSAEEAVSTPIGPRGPCAKRQKWI